MSTQILSTTGLCLLSETDGIGVYRGAKDDAGQALLLLVAASGASPQALRRLDTEFDNREFLREEWATVPKSLTTVGLDKGMFLSDPGGELLTLKIGRPWGVLLFLQVAIGIARSVGRMHGDGVMHRDLKPDHILVDYATGATWFTGFSTASQLPRERTTLDRPDRLAGTFAYMSPEQTGRMNRSIDSRSDLYSLGVIFHEMLVGARPFEATHPLEWIHCHVARLPTPVIERILDIPKPLSAIVSRLLAKTAEERYQTAAGLEFDLQRCLSHWVSHSYIAEFRLGTKDHFGRLAISEKLYGRDHEIATLLAAFGRVSQEGRSEVTLVSGHAGIGKSSLVNEFQKLVALRRGIFISGKFDQRLRNTPYSTIGGAFRGLLRQILNGDDVERWRLQVGQALGNQGACLIEVVPELVELLGTQIALPALGANEASARFQVTFQRLVTAFAREQHPLVLFIDDLQWLDPATLILLERIAIHPETRYLHLIGAYRNNEVDINHPWALAVSAIRASGIQVQHVAPGLLSVDEVSLLVRDTLRIDLVAGFELAAATHLRTGGNPFFVSQFLAMLEEEGALYFDLPSQRWTWDMRVIATKGPTENLADLMVRRLLRLPSAARDLLKTLSCFGNDADLEAISLVTGAERALHEGLRPAVDAGILRVDDGRYRFFHDRVREATYALMEPHEREARHLRVGQALARGFSPEDMAARIFDIANQFNAGQKLLTTQEDRVQSARINLQAGLKAKASSAYDAACAYLEAGSNALTEEGWSSEYGLAHTLCFERAECEISRARVDDASKFVDELIERGRSSLDSARAYVLRMTLQIVRGEMDLVAQSAQDGLRLLGEAFPPQPTQDDMNAEYEAMRHAMGGRSIESLAELPIGEKAEVNAALGILMQYGLAAYFTNANLCQTIVCRIVRMTLAHGLSEASIYGFASLGVSLGPVFRQFADGERFARVAVAITQRCGFLANNAGAHVTLQQALLWTRPVDEALTCLDMSLRIAREAGSPIFACYATEHRLTDLMFRGDSLDLLKLEVANGLAFAERNKVRHVGDIIASMAGFIEALLGPMNGMPLPGDEVAEARALASGIPVVICFHWILQVQRYVVLGDPDRALEYARRAGALLWSARCHVQYANLCFYEALALSASFAKACEAGRTDIRQRMAAHVALLAEWAASCPWSFGHRHALIAGEVARIEGRPLEALQLHEQAIRAAAANGFMHDRALICEFGASHAAALGMQTIATAHLEQARDAYLLWGARGKVAALDLQNPGLAGRVTPRLPPTIEASLEHVDLATIAKMSQTLSGEIVLDRLVDKLMAISIEHAGAQRGVLLLRHMGGLRVEAVALSGVGGIAIERPRRPVESTDMPTALLAEVMQERLSVAIDDGRVAPDWANEPYVKHSQPRSILCLPLVRQGELIGVLHLENNLASHVFTAARHAVIDLVASQAAISLQNADLYSQLERENTERRQSEAALRQSEERYSLAIDAAADGHADWVAETDSFYASPRFLEQWGLSPEMAMSRGRQMIDEFPFHPEDRLRVVNLFKASHFANTRRLEFDARVMRKDEVRWMHVTTLFLRDASGKLLRISTATTDVTERRRMEDELRTSEERYALAVSGSNESIFDLDLETQTLYLAHRTQELMGLVPGEVRRDVESWMQLVRMHPEDLVRHGAALNAHVAGLTEMFDIETRYLLPEGVRWLRQRGRALRDEHGKAYRVVGSVGNITERKREQEEMSRLQRRLRQAERLEAMGTLAGGIAHDFNNILGAILGFGERARTAARRGSQQHRDLTNVVTAGERGRLLVDRILSFSRDSSGTAVFVHVQSVVGEGLALLKAVLPERIRMTAGLHTGRATIRGDATEIHQIVMNLGMNAIHAMADKAGTLSITLSMDDISCKRSATVGAIMPGLYVVLRVADEGSGIPAELMTQIFDPFFTTKDAGAGTGLGLSLVMRIVTQGRGAIDVESRPGIGSTFTVYLPYAGEAAEQAAGSSSPQPRGRGQRILVVDDDEPLLQLTMDVLSEMGYAPVGVRSGRAALKKFREDPESFDALITDHRMSGMSGDALIREVRSISPLLPVVLVSGYLGETSAESKYGDQADELLTKPVRAKALASCLGRLLQRA